MNEPQAVNAAWRGVLAVAAVVIIIAGMRAASAIVVPFLLSGFLAVLCIPPLSWLTRRGIPRGLALLMVSLGFWGAALMLVAMVGGAVQRFARDWPVIYGPKLEQRVGDWNRWIDAKVDQHGWLAAIQIEDVTAHWADWISPDNLMTYITASLQAVGATLGSLFLVLLITMFILLEANGFPDKLRAISSRPDESVARLGRVTTEINRYLGIKTWTSLLTGVCITIGLAVIGVNFALMWGLLAFLLNFVPNIGSILAAVPALLLTLLDQGFVTAGIVAALYLAVNMVIGNYLEPRWTGRGLGLSTLVVFLSLVFWGWVLGPVGVLISVPLTMTAKIVLESHDEVRWLAILMGGDFSDAPSLKE